MKTGDKEDQAFINCKTESDILIKYIFSLQVRPATNTAQTIGVVLRRPLHKYIHPIKQKIHAD